MNYPYLKRLPPFEYLAPETVEQALELLSRYEGTVKLLAGGTDLLLNMKRRRETPRYIIGLKNIRDLDFFNYDESGGLSFGPLVNVHFIETSHLVKEKFPVLAEGAAALGSVQVRNLATVVGNLCSALPSADMAPGLIVLRATLTIRRAKGERQVAVADFFKSPGQSVLVPGELVTEVRVPAPPVGSGMAYLKHMTRSAMDLSIIGVAALIALENDICREARICLGTAGPTPMRATVAEGVLKGKRFIEARVEEAAEAASQECQPRSSMRASAEYRREMVRVLTRRALLQAGGKAG
jgi:aerobic carbon-monoxide dehydrogenase medium subunit